MLEKEVATVSLSCIVEYELTDTIHCDLQFDFFSQYILESLHIQNHLNLKIRQFLSQADDFSCLKAALARVKIFFLLNSSSIAK